MVSFQDDLLITIKNTHNKYTNNIQLLFENSDLTKDLSLDDAENIIEYIKEYNNLINSICLTINKINNIKKNKTINDKIDEELMIKIMPIINVYKILLLEKYKDELNNSIHGLD